MRLFAFGGIEAEVVAHVVDVGAKIGVREHHAFRLAGRAGSVDDGSELAGENLRDAQAVAGNVRGTGSRNKRVVAEAFAGKVRARVGSDDVFEFRKIGANGKKFFERRFAGDENHFGAAMPEDVGHAVG